MFRFRQIILSSAATFAAFALFGEPVAQLRTLEDIQNAVSNRTLGATFDVTATLTRYSPPYRGDIILQSGNTAVSFLNHTTEVPSGIRLGDVIRARGRLERGRTMPVNVNCHRLDVIAHGSLPTAVRGSVRFLRQTKPEKRLVELQGEVLDAFPDEIDKGWSYLVLQDDTGTIFLTVRTHGRDIDPRPFIGATVRTLGVYSSVTGARKLIGPSITVNELGDIHVIRRKSDMPIPIEDIGDFQTSKRSGIRHRAEGTVLAVWEKGNILLRTDGGKIVRGELSSGPPPVCGTRIRLTGLPETDLYEIILIRSSCESVAGNSLEQETPVSVSPSDILTIRDGQSNYHFFYHGRRVRISGKVRSIPANSGGSALYLEQNGQLFIVDTGAIPVTSLRIGIDDVLDVCGVCVMDTEKMGMNHILPRITGYRIVLTNASDVRTVSRPSWWTPFRLTIALGALLLTVLAIGFWNLALRRAVARTAKALEDEITSRISANLKVYERTRLAVELHDTLSQFLTGIVLQLRTAGIIAETNPAAIGPHLTLATKTVDSCREELRNCLWDLRNLALEESNIDEAIRKTLSPHLGATELIVRCNIPRELLTDNTTHAILSIIRELTVNAIRHGKATVIRIAGSFEDDRLLFSVRDNGCGFDPENAPGMAQGHFGLQGIRDRVKAFGGETVIDSLPGRGTKVTITLNTSAIKEKTSA